MAVARPFQHGWVEAELPLLAPGEQVVDLEEAVDLEYGLGLGVRAVQLDVAERPLRLLPALFDPGCQVRLAAPERQRLKSALSAAERPGGLAELVLYPPAAGERPLRDLDRLAFVVCERVLREPFTHQVDELAVAERVAGARSGVDDVGAFERSAGGYRQDGRDHEVDRDDVDDPFGDAGEFLEQAAGIADDHGVSHPEAPYPARMGFRKGGLDDGGAHHRHRQVAAALEKGPFTQGLRVRIGIWPTQRLRPGLAELDHMVLGPVDAQLLGPLGEDRNAGRTQFGTGRGAKPSELFGVTAGCLGVRAGTPGCFDFFPPRDPGRKGRLGQQGFRRRTAPTPRDVRR